MADKLSSAYKVLIGEYVSVPANTPTDIAINSLPNGYTKAVFIGFDVNDSWTAVTVIAIASTSGDWPNRIRVTSTRAQNVRVKLLCFK